MITDYHAKLFAHELRKRHSDADSEKLAGALLEARVDLNPHQVEAALFALKSLLAKGAILANEVGLGKSVRTGRTGSCSFPSSARLHHALPPAPGHYRDRPGLACPGGAA